MIFSTRDFLPWKKILFVNLDSQKDKAFTLPYETI
jgi:hypothetical protein